MNAIVAPLFALATNRNNNIKFVKKLILLYA